MSQLTFKVLTRLSELPRWLKISIEVVADSLAVGTAFCVAMYLRLESLDFLRISELPVVTVALVTFTIMAFAIAGLYQALVRFITGKVLVVIASGASVSGLLVYASHFALTDSIPISVSIIHSILVTIFIGALRLGARQVFRRPANDMKTPAIVFGAGGAGLQLINSLFHGNDYAPVALVDDNIRLHGLEISGLRVRSSSQIPQIVASTGAKLLLLATPQMTRERRRSLVEELEGVPIGLRSIPSLPQIISGEAEITELRPVEPGDLLGRDPVPPDPELMTAQISGKAILVTGAGGSIGSELCRQIIDLEPSLLILLDSSEFALYTIEMEMREKLAARNFKSKIVIVPKLGSVVDQALLHRTFNEHSIDTVFHAAAYKHVPLVEGNVIAGVLNNVIGTWNIANQALVNECGSFTLISTDKAVRPTNIMGATKRFAELICQGLAQESSSTTFSMVRFGNVLGSSGSVIPRFKNQIERGGPVTVTHEEITRYFMTIPEAAQLVIQAGSMAKGGDVFVLDMGDPIKIIDLAVNMIRISGLVPVLPDNASERGDISIEIVGLRPGEKLFEELLIGNNPSTTSHPRILRAEEKSVPLETITHSVMRCEQAAADGSATTIIEEMRSLPLELQR